MKSGELVDNEFCLLAGDHRGRFTKRRLAGRHQIFKQMDRAARMRLGCTVITARSFKVKEMAQLVVKPCFGWCGSR